MTIHTDKSPRQTVIVPGGAILMDEERTLTLDELRLLIARCQAAIDSLEFHEAMRKGVVL